MGRGAPHGARAGRRRSELGDGGSERIKPGGGGVVIHTHTQQELEEPVGPQSGDVHGSLRNNGI